MKKITTYIGLIIIMLMSYIGGYYSNRGIEEPPTEEETVETLAGTTTYVSPHLMSDMVHSTQTYTLPRYYFIGSAGGKPRQQSGSINTDTMWAKTNDTMADTIGRAYGSAIGEADSTVVALPIIQRHYSDKEYEAWVSGPLDPQLDSIKVNAKTEVITKRTNKPPNRWHIGITAGYGYSRHGLEPYIGVGITYSIYSF